MEEKSTTIGGTPTTIEANNNPFKKVRRDHSICGYI